MLTDVINQFHFIEPLWLLGLIPAALILWRVLKHHSASSSAWQKVIDTKFLPFLLIKQGTSNKMRLPVLVLAIGWVLAILALANPSWQRLPQPVFQQLEAQVIVLDLSPSMLAKDVKPSRLIQARYKIEDILRHSKGKQTGLIAYSGDAFTVTPLTDDVATLKSHLRVLEPSLMPASGDRPDLALQQAEKLLHQAGYFQGHIMLFADSAGGDKNTSRKTITAAKKLAQTGYQVSVLGIGTSMGAPVPGARSRNGKPVLSKVDNAALQKIANAGNGVYAAYTSNQQDIKQVLQATQTSTLDGYQGKKKDKQAQRWVQEGPWLAVMLLPLALLAFRRGWFLALSFIVLGQLVSPQPAMAFGWNDMWQRSDQQASEAFQKKDYANAASISPDADLRGAAEYRAGNFKQAAESFSQKKDAGSAYNLGNSLAHLGDYKKSIKAYDSALKQQPQMKDAIENRKLVAELLKEQQQQNKKQQQNKNKKQGKDQNKKSGRQGERGQKNSQNNSGKGKQGEKNSQSAKAGQADKNKQNTNNRGKNKSQQTASKQQNAQNQQQQNKTQKNANSTTSNEKQTAEKQAEKKENKFASAGSKEQQQQANEAVKKAGEKNSESVKQAKENNKPANSNAVQASLSNDKLTPEQRQSVENWLRRVPDDPGGLLRRKFLYQYQQRQQR